VTLPHRRTSGSHYQFDPSMAGAAGLPHTSTLLTTITVTVALGVFAHGLSATPLARRYAAWNAAVAPSMRARPRKNRVGATTAEHHERKARGAQRLTCTVTDQSPSDPVQRRASPQLSRWAARVVEPACCGWYVAVAIPQPEPGKRLHPGRGVAAGPLVSTRTPECGVGSCQYVLCSTTLRRSRAAISTLVPRSRSSTMIVFAGRGFDEAADPLPEPHPARTRTTEVTTIAARAGRTATTRGATRRRPRTTSGECRSRWR
jgi:hypothetical protein